MKKPLLVLALVTVSLAGAVFAYRAATTRADCPGKVVCPLTGQVICADQCPLAGESQAQAEVPSCCKAKANAEQ